MLPRNGRELKAMLLCEGMRGDIMVTSHFARQNPFRMRRGSLSSGGKIKLNCGLFVNVPIYTHPTNLHAVAVDTDDEKIYICAGTKVLSGARVLPAPLWYRRRIKDLFLSQILTAHNRQIAGAVYEGCVHFSRGDQGKFCVINHSVSAGDPRLTMKKPELIIAALEQIPTDDYDGLTLNGGMTLAPGRGMELMVPVVAAISKRFPRLPIAIEITPPAELDWIDRLAEAGTSSLMMNLECWDPDIRRRMIPGKDQLCPRESYLAAFDRAVTLFGRGRVTSCFIVGTEPDYSLKQGITVTVEHGVIPSPLAGRGFEDIPEYPFRNGWNYPFRCSWFSLMQIMDFATRCMREHNLVSTDKAGCVACKMCDLIGDFGTSC